MLVYSLFLPNILCAVLYIALTVPRPSNVKLLTVLLDKNETHLFLSKLLLV